jgi:hypothetical protein
LGGEQIDRHAIALSSRDTRSRRFGLQRRTATPAKSLKLFVRAGAQLPHAALHSKKCNLLPLRK